VPERHQACGDLKLDRLGEEYIGWDSFEVTVLKILPSPKI
jgi:hypothetical protein